MSNTTEYYLLILSLLLTESDPLSHPLSSHPGGIRIFQEKPSSAFLIPGRQARLCQPQPASEISWKEPGRSLGWGNVSRYVSPVSHSFPISLSVILQHIRNPQLHQNSKRNPESGTPVLNLPGTADILGQDSGTSMRAASMPMPDLVSIQDPSRFTTTTQNNLLRHSEPNGKNHAPADPASLVPGDVRGVAPASRERIGIQHPSHH